MKLRAVAGAVVGAASFGLAGPAYATNYLVSATGDTAGAACTPQGTPDLMTCPSLRQAVNEANASPAADDSVLASPGTYTLSAGELLLTDGVSLIGAGGPRAVVISGANASRVIHVVAGATNVLVGGVTIQDGLVTSDRGANILNEGELDLFQVWVSGGVAASSTGGGISNYGGDLTVNETLIEGNHADFSGGGIDNEARGGTPATLHVDDSTLAGNDAGTGGGIATGSPGNSVQLNHVTFSQNFPGGALSISVDGQDVTSRGSIFHDNASNPNCPDSVRKPTDDGFNVDSGTSCAFDAPGSVSAVDPQLSAGLVNAGGPTDLFTIPLESPAAGIVSPCGSGLDQRGYLRDQNFLAACDAGAFEIGGTPVAEQPPIPTPTPDPPPPPAPTPVPTATPAPTAPPVANKSVAAETVQGTVLIKVNGRFVPLKDSVVGNGSEIDARKGRVEITTSTPGEQAVFSDGIFKISQTRGVTTLTLSEPLDCRKAKARAAAKKPKTRKLWGDGKGKFRTKGSYSAATVRGTKWLVQDTCTTTLTRVTRGTVLVRDLVKKRDHLIRKGGRYTARAKR